MAAFPLRIELQTLENQEFLIHVKWFWTIKTLKDELQRVTHIPPSGQQLYTVNGHRELSSVTSLHDLGIDRAGHVLRLSVLSSRTSSSYFVLNACAPVDGAPACAQLLSSVRTGLQRHQAPTKTDVLDCTGGVYFMRGANGDKIAVLKPNDEESGMPNNPKGYKGSGEHGLRPNFTPGFGCMREVAAYVMDVDSFAGVPPTLLVHCEHPVLNYPARGTGRQGAMYGPSMYPKLGSLQQYVRCGDMFEDLGASVLSDLEVQKIALLDLRLLNCDRNAANILAIRKRSGSMSRSREGSLTEDVDQQDFEICFDEEMPAAATPHGGDRYHLVPIDHGYSLPSKLLINEIDWAWFYYPQIARPVHEDVKRYVRSLDIDALVARLQQQVTLTEDSLFLVRVAHQLVADGINAGLTLYDIAVLVARTDEERPSPLEKAIAEAEENAHRTIEMRLGSAKRAMSPAFTFDDDPNLTPAGGATDAGVGKGGVEPSSPAVATGGKRHRRLTSLVDRSADADADAAEDPSSGSARSALLEELGPAAAVSPAVAPRLKKGLSQDDSAARGPRRVNFNRVDVAAAAEAALPLPLQSPPMFCALPSPVRPPRTPLRGAASSSDFLGDYAAAAAAAVVEVPRTPRGPWLAQPGSTSSVTPETVGSGDSAGSGSSRPATDDEGDDTDDAADVTTATAAGGSRSDPAAALVVGSAAHFRAFQGAALRSVRSVDSCHGAVAAVAAAIVSVSALSAAAPPVVAGRMSDFYDSTDSENSTKASFNINTGAGAVAGDKAKMFLSKDGHGLGSSSGSGVLAVPAPVRQHAVLAAASSVHSSFKTLAVSPVRRPSPLKVGSADPLKYQRGGEAPYYVCDADGYNANDEEDAPGGDTDDNGDGGEDSFQNSPVSTSSPMKPPTFLRVTSFSAFSSAPLYDAEGAERRTAHLRKERRRRAESSEEFQRLRLGFTKNAVSALISKTTKARAGTSVTPQPTAATAAASRGSTAV